MENNWWIVTALLTAMSVVAGTLARYAYVGMIKTLHKIQDILNEILQRLAKQDEKNENVKSRFDAIENHLVVISQNHERLENEFNELKIEHRVCISNGNHK